MRFNGFSAPTSRWRRPPFATFESATVRTVSGDIGDTRRVERRGVAIHLYLETENLRRSNCERVWDRPIFCRHLWQRTRWNASEEIGAPSVARRARAPRRSRHRYGRRPFARYLRSSRKRRHALRRALGIWKRTGARRSGRRTSFLDGARPPCPVVDYREGRSSERSGSRSLRGRGARSSKNERCDR